MPPCQASGANILPLQSQKQTGCPSLAAPLRQGWTQYLYSDHPSYWPQRQAMNLPVLTMRTDLQGLMSWVPTSMTSSIQLLFKSRYLQGSRPTQYFQYGPTLDNPAPHWHKFTFDGQTGADFPGGNKIDLYFADGGPGDSKLGVQDGEIRDPSAGAIAFRAPNSSGGGGGSSGGCSLRRSDASIMQGGEWLVLLFMAVMLRLHTTRIK